MSVFRQPASAESRSWYAYNYGDPMQFIIVGAVAFVLLLMQAIPQVLWVLKILSRPAADVMAQVFVAVLIVGVVAAAMIVFLRRAVIEAHGDVLLVRLGSRATAMPLTELRWRLGSYSLPAAPALGTVLALDHGTTSLTIGATRLLLRGEYTFSSGSTNFGMDGAVLCDLIAYLRERAPLGPAVSMELPDRFLVGNWQLCFEGNQVAVFSYPDGRLHWRGSVSDIAVTPGFVATLGNRQASMLLTFSGGGQLGVRSTLSAHDWLAPPQLVPAPQMLGGAEFVALLERLGRSYLHAQPHVPLAPYASRRGG